MTSESLAYLRRCAVVSVRKRWHYPVLSGVILGGLTLWLGETWSWVILTTLVSALVAFALIVLDSMDRHADDLLIALLPNKRNHKSAAKRPNPLTMKIKGR